MGSGIAAMNFFEQAIYALRKVKGTATRRDEVYEMLRAAQKAAVEQFHRIEGPEVNIETLVTHAREHVHGKSKLDALLSLATCTQATNFEQTTKTCNELADKFPLQNLMSKLRLDRDGRIVGRTPTAFTDDPQLAKSARWARVVEHVSMTYGLTAQAEILPAKDQVWFEHKLTLRDFVGFLTGNPLIPEGHEPIIAQGILSGLRDDFQTALSLLVPQLENCLRHCLVQRGIEPSTIDRQWPSRFGRLAGPVTQAP